MKKNPLTFHSADVSIPLKERTRIKSWLQSLAKTHGYSVAELRYIFCSDDFLLEINRSSLDHDYYTDIITFDLRENMKSKKIVGEIYISVDRVRENASDFGVSLASEMKRVLAHGILHLVGFKDKSPSQEAEMRREEDKALNAF